MNINWKNEQQLNLNEKKATLAEEVRWPLLLNADKNINFKSRRMKIIRMIKELKTKKNIIVLLVIITFFTGCFQHYYRTNTQKAPEVGIIDSLRNSNKYFIVHFPSNNMGIENLSVNGDKVEGNMVILPEIHNLHLDPLPDNPNKVKKKDKASTLLEVHLYTDSRPDHETRMSIPLSSINRIDVYTFDEKATRKNRIFSTVGIAISVALVIGFISLAGVAAFPSG